jgi:hypothetical protein
MKENYKLQNTNYKQITNYKLQITNLRGVQQTYFKLSIANCQLSIVNETSTPTPHYPNPPFPQITLLIDLFSPASYLPSFPASLFPPWPPEAEIWQMVN